MVVQMKAAPVVVATVAAPVVAATLAAMMAITEVDVRGKGRGNDGGGDGTNNDIYITLRERYDFLSGSAMDQNNARKGKINVKFRLPDVILDEYVLLCNTD